MITKQLPERREKWSQKYSKALEFREKKKLSFEQERKGYIPRFVKSNSVTGFVDRERELDPIPYNEDIYGSRNSLCSVCNLLIGPLPHAVCDLCPAVAHDQCAKSIEKGLYTFQKHFTPRYRNRIESKMQKHGLWCCSLCSEEIHNSIETERRRLKDDRFRRMAFFAAMKLQANCMRFKAQRRYNILYRGMLRLQARCRGVQIRKLFMIELATTHRAFRIKHCDFVLPGMHISDNKPNLSCIICIINDENNGLDDAERQMYRFDTHGVPITQNHCCGKWNDSFIVHSCNTIVKIAFTLHAKDNEHSSARTIFMGQYTADARPMLTKSFFNGKPFRVKGDLRSLDIEPRDQRFSFSKAENGCVQQNNAYGKVSCEIHPISNVESKCGIIEEILSAVLKGAKKKWHAVLAERHLYLFSQYGDARPKITIHLTHGHHVTWYDEKCDIIKISNLNNQCWLFSCANPQQLEAWYNKLTGAYSSNLQDGANIFTGNEKC